MVKKEKQQNSIVIYTSRQGVDLRVRTENESVWLTQAQISDLYGKDRTVITKHVNNLFKDKEVDEKSNVQKMHIAKSDKPVALYSLDIILAVGYRTNSAQAIQFRKWATSVLKKYLIDGYAINEKRLEDAKKNFSDLQSVIQMLGTKISSENLKGQEQEIFSLLVDYSKTLSVLEQYDKSALKEPKGGRSSFALSHEDAMSVLLRVRTELAAKGEATELFANERDGSFSGIVKGLYQTFGGKELYKSIEDKAAHLLYFTIKDHPFSDGNKRSGAFLFVYFLDKNKYLHKKSGEKKINDNALAALALLVAESDPKEKNAMIKLIVNLIAE
jgi:prophage maintenance system killer protein/prophage antirepressor-like protein